MRNLFLTTTVGALVGVAVSMSIPHHSSRCKFIKNKNKFIRRGKKIKAHIIKKIAGVIYKIA